MNVRPKVQGRGAITRRCHVCGQPIAGDPVLITRAGRLYAYHADCHTKER